MSKRKSRIKNEPGDSKSFKIVNDILTYLSAKKILKNSICIVPIKHGVTKLLQSVQVKKKITSLICDRK